MQDDDDDVTYKMIWPRTQFLLSPSYTPRQIFN